MAAPEITKVSILGKDSIHCGFHLTPYIAHTVTRTLPSSTYVLITDTNVAKHHLSAFQDAFGAYLSEGGSKARFLTHVIQPGEGSKSREGKAEIEDFLLKHACTRDTVILALGGGVIGDLVGFVAATFMRGVRFCQIPTTLLAMVDSSVGGKTAIDTPHGKNLIGAFWQPEYIFIDASFLSTLPVREFSTGMAEVVKTAAIWNADEFASLESGAEALFAALRSPPTATITEHQRLLLRTIAASISVKAHIVTIDERETGLRNLVNFGHTIGHALEAVLTPAALHGECVSIGMVLEAEVARARGVLGQGAVGRLTRCLKAYDLPVSVHDPRITKIPASKDLCVQRLLDIMKIDKKNSGPEKKIVLLSRIGATHEQKASVVKDEVIARTLCEAVKVQAGAGVTEVTMATPGSKSVSNRALVLAALGTGTCRLKNLLTSDDTQVMMAALQDLQGASFEWEDGGETLVVHGGGGNLTVPPAGKEIYLGNAGTAARFLTTVCTLVAPSASSAQPASTPTVITGNARMKQRPIGPLVDALRANGSTIAYHESEGCLPLSIAPQSLKGGHVKLAASVSSQYVSSILLCAPYAQEPVTLELTGGQVISQLYIDMTLAMMRAFGVSATRRGSSDVYDIPKATYRCPEVYEIESDASSATYPLAIAAITGTQCTISTIGSASLQGDARFAKDVLEPMGCEVVQTATTTRVKGPPVGTLKALGEVDMEPMTDAFLTASVVAAVATGVPKEGRVLADAGGKNATRILGISNQRVKECNRIRAMIDQLAKFGVQTKELDDGLEIYGTPIESLKTGVSVHCYDDHRVAMAFSVLGTVAKDTILEEKRCVEKTWPNWWDDLENKIGIPVEGVELPKPAATPKSKSPSNSGSHSPSASVVISGMRGSGKTYIGEHAAAALGWTFIDADAHFESVHKTGVREFVHEKGWEAFRAAEADLLNDLLATRGEKHVLSLGGGIVETPACREALKAYAANRGPVVHIVRQIDEVAKYLGEETARPQYGEPVRDVFRRREPWFIECCSYQFVNHTGLLQATPDAPRPTIKTAATQREVKRFFGHITGQQPNLAPNLAPGRRSYFLSLTYPDIGPALAHIDELTTGVDAVELRVDLLRLPQYVGVEGSYIPPASYVADQLAALRQATPLPVVYTVRTVAQGGSFPDAAKDEALELLDLGLRMGVEYLDVEISLPEKDIQSLVSKKGASQIIASWHDWSGKMKWTGKEVATKYELAHRLGDIVKIIGKADSLRDNLDLLELVSWVSGGPNAKPVIAINMGQEGQMSRIMNPTFSPVSHPLLPSKAAPGQLSFAQIQQALHLLGQLPRRRFFLFGNPIAHSMSPTIHNTGFEILGLPHVYELMQTEDVGEHIKQTLEQPDFGGASVTIPFKVDVIPLLDELSPAAKAIGAVNTIIPVSKGTSRTLYGDNSDWLGIRECVEARLPSRGGVRAGLVIGAGGTARAALYALHALGAERLYIFNRTTSKAQALVDAFPDMRVELVSELGAWPQGGPSPNVIVGTVPATGTTTDASNQGAILLLDGLFGSTEGVVVDMAYKPAETPLLTLARKFDGWSTVRGVDVLLEQGFVQFEKWTGRRCPRGAVTQRVLQKYEQ